MHMHIIKGLAGGCLGAKGLSHLFFPFFLVPPSDIRCLVMRDGCFSARFSNSLGGGGGGDTFVCFFFPFSFCWELCVCESWVNGKGVGRYI